ncbi:MULTISPECIES: TetR/AcrR family transcriptional regulator [Streptomyces]|uniref:TetR/AcrR family transcriptional regulator n=2 Tax=Streptomyces TaxID=1883 RepID=UPI0016789023|nr:TetR/AcrR family transcriptional regulator [Streptomyces thermoviolaceus]MCM3266933.1 TetR/AcrR family transcriptional regulator [Streptomyces thermoviolaceus]WTD48543.1 TetR/AcrR family transcriptional regulator [Streptomyces thermoviolaceus]GGV73212.1 TetR family transcriptional regulator [Streptomyces thermoviolaceus subsp. apingens]GHA89322.1 TetR family transcriptional regulator [Streptomyces thermoviolaceus subsp. thermoviolaceus]
MGKPAGVRGAARTSVWLEDRTRRSARGGQPSGLDLERITEASVRLLDAEGMAKFSMRRLAAELNVTAMSLYWYVSSKDDLLELALDATFGELRLPDEQHDEDWRKQLRDLAGEYRALLVRHPWLSPLVGSFLNIGPNHVAFSDAVHRIIRRTGLPEDRLAGAISAVFRFVYGYGTNEGHFAARCAAAGMAPDEYFQHAVSVATSAPDAAEVMRESIGLLSAGGGDTVAQMLDRDFDVALDLLIAGIEATVARNARD